MPFNAKLTAGSLAVVTFFIISIIGSLENLTPYICSKRALLGAIVIYITVKFAVLATNSIITHAIINRQIQKQEEFDSDDFD
jgi:VIT1/CCC1 family predicted Fe2+/Mn2+ transporter